MDERTDQISAAADSEESRSTAISGNDYDENTEQLRADIEDTRADMTQTINEIQERLSPEHLVGQVKETVREATIGKVEKVVGRVGETLSEVSVPAREMAERAGNAIKEVGTTVGNQIWNNPIPLALIGLGVGMLVMKNYLGSDGKISSGKQRYARIPQGGQTNYAVGDVGQPRRTQQSTGQSMAQQTMNAASGTLNQVKETATDFANRSTQTLTDLGTKAKDGASRLGELMRENPLAAGAVAIAAGTAVGLMIPSTQIENEYIGETGEMLVERVEDVARDALGKVQDAAKQMAPNQAGQQPQPGA